MEKPENAVDIDLSKLETESSSVEQPKPSIEELDAMHQVSASPERPREEQEKIAELASQLEVSNKTESVPVQQDSVQGVLSPAEAQTAEFEYKEAKSNLKYALVTGGAAAYLISIGAPSAVIADITTGSAFTMAGSGPAGMLGLLTAGSAIATSYLLYRFGKTWIAKNSAKGSGSPMQAA